MSGNTKWMLGGEAPKPATWPQPKKSDEKAALKAASVKALPDDEKKGMRGHSDLGQVRPADERFNLHAPKEESKYVRVEQADDNEEQPRSRRRRRN